MRVCVCCSVVGLVNPHEHTLIKKKKYFPATFSDSNFFEQENNQNDGMENVTI